MTDKFDGAKLESGVRAHIERNMAQVTLYVKGQAQKNVNRGNADGSSPSKVGESPKKVTARLFQSIATGQEVTPTSVIGKVGTNVEYARRLELGFVGTEQVPAHTRTITQAFGKPLASPKTVSVGAYARSVSQGARPFLRPAVSENLANIGKILAKP